MKGFILGTKGSQSQTFDKNGLRIPTSYIKTSPCYIVGIKSKEENGYCAIQLGFGTCKKISKPMQGVLTKAGVKTPLRFLREFRVDSSLLTDEKLKPGTEIKPEMFFKVGDSVTISGYAKGKGFQGVVKRHGFKGGSRTHGQSDRERAPGSIGMTTTPGRVFKGKRMAGRMGNQKVTISNFKVLSVDENGMTVKGLIPGSKNMLITVVSSL